MVLKNTNSIELDCLDVAQNMTLGYRRMTKKMHPLLLDIGSLPIEHVDKIVVVSHHIFIN